MLELEVSVVDVVEPPAANASTTAHIVAAVAADARVPLSLLEEVIAMTRIRMTCVDEREMRSPGQVFARR